MPVLEDGRYVYKHVFDFYYKWCPSASLTLPIGWPNLYNIASWNGQGLSMINGFYEYGTIYGGANNPTILTRESAPLSTSAGALPWGSPAADFLWNCLVPTQSGFTRVNESTGESYANTTTYTFTYSSASFFYTNGYSAFTERGIAAYPITSSWKAIEPFMTHSKMVYTTIKNGTQNVYEPSTIHRDGTNTQIVPYAQPSAFSSTIPGYQEDGVAVAVQAPLPNGTNPEMITFGDASTGSFDGRFYDLAGGIGISRYDISASLAGYASQSNSQTTAVKINLSNELKRRRLFFPTIATGSSATGVYNPPYTGVEWFTTWTTPVNGFTNTVDIFNTNGAIFNVKFNLKKDTTIDMFPDTGENSQLLVYIFNVKPNVGNTVDRVAGTAGFYPPENNIVRIKNNPAMSFINPATGFLIESFNINVVQYGTNAQLVFEASGSLDDDTYFGCIIDDVEFCQVGVSTDPSLIEPETIGSIVVDQAQDAILVGK